MSQQLVGKPVSKTGFGLMGLTWRPTPIPFEESIEIMHQAFHKHGANFFVGGVFYGPPERNSLHLLKAYFDKYPEDAEKVIVSIKGGNDPKTLAPQANEKDLTADIEFCLKTLDNKKIDIFEASRVDPKVPIEDSLSYIKRYVDAGKIGGVAISEVNATSVRKAAKFTNIVACEIEFSLFHTAPLTNGVFAACKEHNIPVIAYSPLGRGFLTGQIRTPEDIPEGDFRRTIPRFQGETFYENIKLVRAIEQLAEKKGCTSGQVALSWIEQQSGRNGNPVIIPIPGTTSQKRLVENMVRVHLTDEDFKEIDGIIASIPISGTRYGGHALSVIDG
ncbi:aldo/keto reductase-like protein [Pseudovirgaria hyperparasitica]|uniref:Aldo/keto reductase-like protein n=1 Tax=Pseudovirgaria hyperparasitica TaxID=470096 RepID=A0A6A6WIR1_9PEZI|nr:aldo/keto reductase-like protein [Pseudovirgaria hyperparasitica]KAF2762034.1 aldo/keto reductase-like protein [Pseudovirgaria hyperparasitica]